MPGFQACNSSWICIMAESDNSDSVAGDQPGTAFSLANQSNEQLMSNISFKMKDLECLSIATGIWGVWCKCHNLSIIPPPEHNFEHNTLGFTGDARKHSTLFYEHNPTDPSRGWEDNSACRVLFTLYRAFSHDVYIRYVSIPPKQ